MEWLVDLPQGLPGKILRVSLRYWRSGGWLMLPLGAVAFSIFYRYLSLLGRFRKAGRVPHETALRVEKMAAGQRGMEALKQWLTDRSGAIPRILRHVLARMDAGEPFRKAYAECREAELGSYPRAFTLLAGLVAAAPLLGLLGTVLGMIETFTAVGSGTGRTSHLVAGGISKALITTQAGLAVAVAGTFCLAHLRRLHRKLRNDINHWESHLKLIFDRAPDSTPGR